MSRILLAFAPLALAACQMVAPAGGPASAPAQTFEEARAPFPPEVLRALPPGVSLSSLRVSQGCYFYETAGGMRPVTASQITDGSMADTQVCVG